MPSNVFGLEDLSVYSKLGLSSVTDLQFIYVVVAFVINYACYFSVIIEGGIKNVSVGQHEAGKVLGMTKGQIFRHVILMQVVRKITAPMSNEIITLVKDTALASSLVTLEIMGIAWGKVSTYAVFSPLVYASLFYLAFSGILTIVFHYIDKKLSYYSV